MIKENFLYFIWRLQYFNKQDLITTAGEKITILNPGELNTDAGPDFINARIKIGAIEWCGNVEIHVQSSQWNLHEHPNDKAYDNIILHVVYSDDEPVRRDSGELIPAIELQGRIDERLILKYSSVVSNKSSIPCHRHLEAVPSVIKSSMIERAITERIEEKSDQVIEALRMNKGDWHETNYHLLSKNFGFKLNTEPFYRLAKSIPLKLLLKHRNNQEQVEALLFGQAGFLDEKPLDDYQQRLKREYDFLSTKYSMGQHKLEKHDWKFLRIRPANFPTVRIAQLASIIAQMPEVITSFTEFNSVNEVYNKLSSVTIPEYWRLHYTFGDKESIKHSGALGKDSVHNIIINTIAILYFAIGKEKALDHFKEKAIQLIETVPSESNKIIREWEKIGLFTSSGFDSQGVIQLYNKYCKNKLCLQCEIGASIFKMEEVGMSV